MENDKVRRLDREGGVRGQLVLGSPVYFCDFTAGIKAFIERAGW